MHSLRKLLGISWMSRTPNTAMLSRCGLPTTFTMLCQRRLRWLGHVKRMKAGIIPKYIQYGERIAKKCNLGRPQLRYRDVCKRDMKDLNIDLKNGKNWPLATDHSKRRRYLKVTLKVGKKHTITALENKLKLKKNKIKNY